MQTQPKSTPFRQVLIRSGLVASAGLILGRLSGFVRELILASQVGVSERADVAVLVLTYPDFLISLFIGGAMSAAFIPELYHLPPEEHRPFFWRVFWLVAGSFGALSLLLFVGSSAVTFVLAPGLDAEAASQTSRLLSLTTMAIPFVALAAVTRCFLQAKNRFALISLENFIYNLVLMLGLAYLFPMYNGLSLPFLVLVGALLRFVPQLWLVRRTLPKPGSLPAPKAKLNRDVLRRYIEALGAGTILVSLPIIARSIGSLSGEGNVAIFNYALKMVEVPTAIVISASSLVLLPQFASFFSNQPERAIHLVQKVFLRLVFLSSAIGLYISWFLWGLVKGNQSLALIQPDDLAEIALLSIFGMAALPARALIYFNNDLLTAKRDTRSGFLIALGSLALSFPLIAFMGSQMELRGVYIGMGIIHWLTWAVGVWRIHSHHGIRLIPPTASLMPLVKSTLILIGPFACLSALDGWGVDLNWWMRLGAAGLGGALTTIMAFGPEYFAPPQKGASSSPA